MQPFAEELRDAGVRLLQYRDKQSGPREILRAGHAISDVFQGRNATLILNDRADLAALLGWGVHVGQGDLPVEAARRIVGKAMVGVSTHNEQQVIAANATPVDYIAVGPIFATTSKHDAASVIGLPGLRGARSLATKPLVAIGGISEQNVSLVFSAGADAIAVISALMKRNENLARVVGNFLQARGGSNG